MRASGCDKPVANACIHRSLWLCPEARFLSNGFRLGVDAVDSVWAWMLWIPFGRGCCGFRFEDCLVSGAIRPYALLDSMEWDRAGWLVT